MTYRRMDQYPGAQSIPGVLPLGIEAPIYFANVNYLRERIFRWIGEEEERLRFNDKASLHYVVLDMGAVTSIDTSGISMMKELKQSLERRQIQLVLANPGSEMMKKLDNSKVLDIIGHEWIFLTVGKQSLLACSTQLKQGI
ncbi:hypothetical protein HPP92_023235 [Vanilla planifolia]|uniref:STAS domain-containing protein n=1 Tax=Vanilla planifolia TaxID=51239 RepID=A0A835Q275_VANPL|nr:hypothetical protein HPP92_023235 [Vanilla planifolia]